MQLITVNEAAAGTLNPRNIIVPGFMIDYAVVAPAEKHPQVQQPGTYNSAWSQEYRVSADRSMSLIPLDERKIIARRAAMELQSPLKSEL